MKKEIEIKVVAEIGPRFFSEALEKVVNEFTEAGYNVEIQSHLEPKSLQLIAVVIGRQKPQYFVSPKIETKVELNGRTIGQKIGDFMGMTPPSRAVKTEIDVNTGTLSQQLSTDLTKGMLDRARRNGLK